MMSSYNRLLSRYVCLKSRDVSKLLYLLATIPVLQKKPSKFERINGCNYSFIIKRGLSPYGLLLCNCELALKIGMPASACFKQTQYPRSLQVASSNNDGTTQMYGCKCFFEIAAHLKQKYSSNTSYICKLWLQVLL